MSLKSAVLHVYLTGTSLPILMDAELVRSDIDWVDGTVVKVEIRKIDGVKYGTNLVNPVFAGLELDMSGLTNPKRGKET